MQRLRSLGRLNDGLNRAFLSRFVHFDNTVVVDHLHAHSPRRLQPILHLRLPSVLLVAVLVEREFALRLGLLLSNDALGLGNGLLGHLGRLHQHAHVVEVVLGLDFRVRVLLRKLRASLIE